MANETNQIAQIYELRSLGFKQITGELEAINKLMADIATNKKNAASGSGVFIDPALLKQIRDQLAQVSEGSDAVTKSVGKQLDAFQQLKKQYDDASANAKALAAEFGASSEQARVAAVSAASYKDELLQINDLLKNPPRASQSIVSTDNLAALEAEQALLQQTGVAVSELEVAQAQAANEATAWGQANQAAAEQVAASGAAVEAVTTPLQEYTGSLLANIKQQAGYSTRLAEISAELKTNASTYDAAGKKTDEYKNKQAALLLEQKELKIASADLGQTINAQTKYTQAAEGSVDQLSAKLGILRNTYRGLNAEEKASSFGQQLTADIQVLDTQVKKAEGTVGNFQRNVGNYAGKAFGYVRQLAQILPGIGIAGLFGVAFEGIQALFEKISESIGKGTKALTDYKVAQDDVRKALDSPEYSKAIINFNELRINVELAKNGLLDKDKVLKQYNDSLGKTTGQVSSLDEAEQALVKNGPAYLRMQLLKAASLVAQQEAAKKLVEAEAASRKELEDFANSAADARISTGGSGFGTGQFNAKEYDAETQRIKQAREKRRADVVAISQKAADQQESIATKFQQDAAKIAKQSGFDFFGGDFDPKVKKTGADSLGAGNTNALNIIESQRKAELNAELKRIGEIRKVRDLSDQEEIDSLNTLQQINDKYLDQKIKAIRGNNAKEREEKSAFDLEKTTSEGQTLDKIAAINKKAFDKQLADAQATRDALIKAAQRTNQLVQESTTAAPSDKATAKEVQDQAILNAENAFVDQYNALEKQYSQNTAQNTKARQDNLEKAQAAEDQLRKDRRASALAELQDIQADTDKQVALIKVRYAQMKLAILESDKNSGDKSAAIETLDKAETLATSAQIQDGANKALDIAQKLYDAGLITADQLKTTFEAAVTGAQNLNTAIKSTQQNITSLSGLLTKGLGNLFGFAQTSDKAKVFAQAINEAFSSANAAENEYFSAQQDRIKRSNDAQLKQLDIQQQAALARATSTAQENQINEQFQKKRDAANKSAFDQQKKIQIAQAEINLATQLSNIAVIAFAPNPLNIATLGAAGAVAYAIEAAAAIGGFAVNVARIKRATYAYGGNPDMETTRGGRVKGRSHSNGGNPVWFKGRVIEDEVDELNIIRTRNVPPGKKYTISGTHTQIASALNQLGGGVSFSTGARVNRYAYGGTVPGSALSAPLYIPRYASTSTDSSQTVNELRNQNQLLMGYIAATNGRIDNLQVQQVTSSVTNAQRKAVNQASIATIGRKN